MKLLVLGEEDKSLNCEENFNHLLCYNIVINTSVSVIAKVNGVFHPDNSKSYIDYSSV